MDAVENPRTRSPCFVMVRSIWLPSNEFLAAASAVAVAAAAAATTWCCSDCRAHAQALFATLAGGLVQWFILRGARAAEERIYHFSSDVRADRAAMPLFAFSILSAAMSGGAWLVLSGVRAVIESTHLSL